LKRRPSAVKPSPSSAGNRYVALLRAINVGGHTVTMEQLRGVFQSLGLANVQTFIASGNVIFESPATAAELEPVIEGGLQKALGYPVLTFLRSRNEMTAVAACSAFAEADLAGASVYVVFLKDRPGRAAATKVLALGTDLDGFHVRGREVYWLRRKVKERAGDPFPPIERMLGVPGTSRNVTTVRKIAAKFCQ
jgi:uncharacterized protein (DUF1697 family)